MKPLKDSSEIRETVSIFNELVAAAAVIGPAGSKPAAPAAAPVAMAPRNGRRPAVPASPLPREPDMSDYVYRGDRLENVLFAMCKKGGFTGAILADVKGLPVAIYNSPVDEDIISAMTTVLGEALETAGKLIEQPDANNISMDISYLEKAVLRRFLINDQPYFILIICAQDVDERVEVELSIEQVISILEKPGL